MRAAKKKEKALLGGGERKVSLVGERPLRGTSRNSVGSPKKTEEE